MSYEKHPFILESVQSAILRDGSRDQIICWLEWNDRNGCYSDAECDSQGIPRLTIETARECMRAECAGYKKFLVKDNSGRNFSAEVYGADFTDEDREYCPDPDNQEDTFGDWLDAAEIGDEFTNEDDHQTIIRIS